MAQGYFNSVDSSDIWEEAAIDPNLASTILHTQENLPITEAMGAMKSNQQSVATRQKAISWVKMAPDILKAMSLAAQHAGRTAGDVWAEAAREWLLSKSLETEYDILSNQPPRTRDQAAIEEKRSRLWNNIDSLMGAIRDINPSI
jgi:hypothetical protein